jgi:hypothetical protein
MNGVTERKLSATEVRENARNLPKCGVTSSFTAVFDVVLTWFRPSYVSCPTGTAAIVV